MVAGSIVCPWAVRRMEDVVNRMIRYIDCYEYRTILMNVIKIVLAQWSRCLIRNLARPGNASKFQHAAQMNPFGKEICVSCIHNDIFLYAGSFCALTLFCYTFYVNR